MQTKHNARNTEHRMPSSPTPAKAPRKPRAHPNAEIAETWSHGIGVWVQVHEPWKEGRDFLTARVARELGQKLIRMADWIDAQPKPTRSRRGAR